jgi:inorganic pyrophosphatase
MNPDTSFWIAMNQFLAAQTVIIDRPKGSPHPRYPDVIHPLDYGYLANTKAADGDGIDVWLGSLDMVMSTAQTEMLTGILCTFDTLKRDAEIKLLIGCSIDDIDTIRAFHKDMHTLYIPNPLVIHDVSD